MMDERRSVETLGQSYSLGWRVHMRCDAGKQIGLKRIKECLYIADLDMMTLVATRGWDFPLARLAERLRCPRCGSRQVVIWFDLPQVPVPAAAKMP